jgi:predicted acylesterase/phospholipase RssA/CRP-like cAMP-binding protein
LDLAVVRELKLLSRLSDQDLEILSGLGQWNWFQPGEMIVRQGQEIVDFFIVGSGRVELLIEGDVPTRLGLLGPGDFFGELPALTGESAPATAVAREVTTLLRLSNEGLMLLLERNLDLSREIIATLSTRIRETGARLHRARLRERTLSDHIARQGELTHPEWIGAGPWSQRVRAAIARASRTLEPVVFVGEPGTGKELTAARVHYNSGRKGGPFIVLEGADWSEQRWREARRMAAHGTLLIKHAHLLPPEAAPLVQRILPRTMGGPLGGLPDQVARVMATAPAPDEREPCAVEQVILDEGFAVPVPPLRERREDIPSLVRHFLKRFGYFPGGAEQPVTPEALRKLEAYPFLSANVRELERVIHQAILLAGGAPIDVDQVRLGPAPGRLGRPRVGVALGGGIVRGCAHIGVLRALHEAGVPVDLVAGTSSGALIGALAASGRSWNQVAELVRTTGWLDLVEPCWPRGGFLTNFRTRQFLERYAGPALIEGLPVPFACVAADALTGQEVIFRQGLLADAVRASTAIPGIFRPVEVEGRWLVDGVVVNNVPASVVRAMGADLVIAVDVTSYGFNAGPPKGFVEAITRSFDIMARQTIVSSLEWADVVIRPQVAGLNGYKFATAPEFIQRGYAAARDALPEIRARLAELQQAVG